MNDLNSSIKNDNFNDKDIQSHKNNVVTLQQITLNKKKVILFIIFRFRFF